MPANFKSFEAQSRLLAAVVAAHPGLKLDYRGKDGPNYAPSSSHNFLISLHLPCVMYPPIFPFQVS